MTEFLTYLNPKKVVDPVLEYISELEKLEGFPFDNGMKVSISVHIGSALERMVQHCGLKYDGNLSEDNQKKLDTYQTIARCFQKKLAINLDRDELSYILEMVAELSERSAAQQEDLS
ncbi:NtrC family Transcriptional regulator [Klebsiella michiganensis]|nr:NtrC family Transcriptional regulator [Klebsiella michiganensis]